MNHKSYDFHSEYFIAFYYFGWEFITALCSILVFGYIVYLTNFHFKKEGNVPLGMKLIALASVTNFGGFIVNVFVVPFLMLIPCGLYVTAVLLIEFTKKHAQKADLSLAYSMDKPKRLIKTGPYRWIRHPFYCAYLCYWLGNATATKSYLGWVNFVLLGALYYNAASIEERKFLNSPLNSSYKHYRDTVGMFLPRLKRSLISSVVFL